MTNTYTIANEITKEIVNIHNARYEAIRNGNFELTYKLENLEDDLKNSLANFGYMLNWIYDETTPWVYCSGFMASKVIEANIKRVVANE